MRHTSPRLERHTNQGPGLVRAGDARRAVTQHGPGGAAAGAIERVAAAVPIQHGLVRLEKRSKSPRWWTVRSPRKADRTSQPQAIEKRIHLGRVLQLNGDLQVGAKRHDLALRQSSVKADLANVADDDPGKVPRPLELWPTFTSGTLADFECVSAWLER